MWSLLRTNAETAKKTEEDRYDSVKAESSAIQISSTRNARRLYTDSGTGANQDLSIFEAYLPSGYLMIGHYAQRNHDRQVNSPIPMVRPLQSDAIVTPDSFYQLYTDRGTGGRQDLSLWQPITRNNRYVCLGTVASLDYSAPYGLRNRYACLRKDLVEQGIFGYEIWNDRGSGGREDVSLWSVESYSHRSSGYFVANNRYSKPQRYYAMAIKGI